MNPYPSSRRCLWKNPSSTATTTSIEPLPITTTTGPGSDKEHDNDNDKENDGTQPVETYDSILKRFSVEPPPPKSLSTLCCNSLVVGQEFALTCLFWARHRAAIWEEEAAAAATTFHSRRKEDSVLLLPLQRRMVLSQSMALLALIVIAIVTNSSASSPPQPQPRKAKVLQRSSDAILWAILLRLLASILRTLTASFSTDTVERLTVTGMVIHWFTCDYSYANAMTRGKKEKNAMMTNTGTKATSTGLMTTTMEETTKTSMPATMTTAKLQHSLPTNPAVVVTATTTTTTTTTTAKRPTFQGGAISLNAAFFSTTLLASRLSSNATVYIFVSSAIILFAFFPAARHAISHHPHRAAIHSFVTLMLSWSTFYLLKDTTECRYFAGFLVMICGITPVWKFWLQGYKRKISGPWDVVSVGEMMLDY